MMNKGRLSIGIAIILVALVLSLVVFGPMSSTFLGSASSTSTTEQISSSTNPSRTSTTSSSTIQPPLTTTTGGSSTSSSTSLSTSTSNFTTSTSYSSAFNGTGSIEVVGTMLNGTTPVNGVLVDLRINGTNVATGYTPVTFTNLKLGLQYGVVVYWYKYHYIRYINDSNVGIDLQRYDVVTLNQTNPTDNLTAAFEYVPPNQEASLNIMAEFPNGTRLGTASVVNGYDLHSPGMWLSITPPFQSTPYTGTFTGGSILPFILFDHESYTVSMSYGYYGPWITNLSNTGPTVCIVWSHWEDDGSTNATRAIMMNGNATYVTIYNQVSTSSCTATTISSTTSVSFALLSLNLVVLSLATFEIFCYYKSTSCAKKIQWFKDVCFHCLISVLVELMFQSGRFISRFRKLNVFYYLRF